MDVAKLLKNVHTLNEYISTTQHCSEKYKNSKILLNMSTVLALKKLRSIEIEYFNKCEENGIACLIYERMLRLPPSKTWGVLSKELVNLLQYWLDVVRKHLLRHISQWWTFLKLLLRFLKEIREKDVSLPNILVEQTAECLLDLATNSRLDAYQRYEILHCFNMYCSESSREIRFALRNKFGQYFIKLSTYMASCGHLPVQYSIMETLLRWLLPRQDTTLRVTSAAKWFQTTNYAETEVDIFLKRTWLNFFQDARDFLNAHNQRHDLITSVVCRKLTVGKVVIISESERQESWLDINLGSGSVSVLLDPRLLQSFGANNQKSFETLVVTQQNTHSAKLHRESLQVLLSIRTMTPPPVLPSCVSLGDDVGCDVVAVVTTRCDVKRLDDALRKIFEDKYELSLDLDRELELSPLRGAENSNHNTASGEDPRFSHPVEVKRRKRFGRIVRPRQPVSCKSPSTTSTSSLAQLHEKLAALPRYSYDKEIVRACATPGLSIVTELSEADDRTSSNSTLKFKQCGACYKNLNNLENKKSQSDPESSRDTGRGRRLSPIINEETTSSLLVATLGSADDSVINGTIERPSKSKDYNPDKLIDLLVQEALQAKTGDRDKSDSGINTRDKKSVDLNENSETIDNTPEIDKIKLNKFPKRPKVVSSTDDDSNTDAINETPSFVSTRRRDKKEVKDPAPRETDELVEEFLSQHFTENKNDEVVISPTLAKKINETSSKTRGDFDENLNINGDDLEEDIVPYDFNSIEVLECLNSMVDKVCDEFDKCTKYLNKEDEIIADPNDSVEDNIPLKDIINTIQDIESNKKETKQTDAKKKIKLKYKIISPKKTKARAAKRKNKLVLESTSKMSIIVEDKGQENTTESFENEAPTETKEKIEEETRKELPPIDAGDSKTPLTRKKRTLYSPKDGEISAESPQPPVDDTVLSEILQMKKTPKFKVTCHKGMDKVRQRIRIPRASKSKVATSPSIKKTKNDEIFDALIKSANHQKVQNNFEADVYNYTSDSDDDFKAKKIEISKRNSTTTNASIESTVPKKGRVLKKKKYTAIKSSDEKNKVKLKVNRTPAAKKKINVEQHDLVDERMRQTKDVFNTSIVVENTKNTVTQPDLVLKTVPEMEVIEEQSNDKPAMNLKNKTKKIKVEKSESKRPKRVLNKSEREKVINVDEDRTESPLSGLLIEIVTNKENINDISASMADKFRKIYQECPDNYINESNTHNLLSDLERIPPNVDTTEDFTQIVDLESNDESQPIKTSIKKKKSNSTLRNTKKDKITSKKKDNILEISVEKSEKSIETIGITGHGELEEAPPSPNLINERLEPRNLEVEYLSNSLKEYFDKLTKEMNLSTNRDTNGSNDDNSSKISLKANNNRANSPVVCVKMLSLEDISRWLPSSHKSDSEESNVCAKSAKKGNSVIESPIISESKHNDNDSEVSEITDTIRRSMRLVFQNSQPVKINDSGQTNGDSGSESDGEPIKKMNKKAKITPKALKRKNNTKPLKKTVKKEILKRASIISPIKLFDEIISNADKQSAVSLSDDEEYMKEIMHTLTTKKVENLPKTKMTQEKTRSKIFEQKNVAKSVSSAPSHSKTSTSNKIEDSTSILKRRLDEERVDSKKRKMEVNNNEGLVSSGVTVSSVDDWFKRMEPQSSRSEVINASTRHIMQEVLERLDTTLVEINRNTSKKFVHLFTDAQKNLSELKEKRHGMYTEMTSEILSEVVRIMDNKLAGLNKRLQELDDDFMHQLKQRSLDLIREDCKHTKVMVQLLKEDMQAVLDHIDRQSTL